VTFKYKGPARAHIRFVQFNADAYQYRFSELVVQIQWVGCALNCYAEKGKIMDFSDFQNQNQITAKLVILKLKSNYIKVGDLNDFDYENHDLILKMKIMPIAVIML